MLANQLRRYARSIPLLSNLAGDAPIPGLRSEVLRALVALARDFATVSSAAARGTQAGSLAAADAHLEAFVGRLDGVVSWDTQKVHTRVALEEDGGIVSLNTGAGGAAIRAFVDRAAYAHVAGGDAGKRALRARAAAAEVADVGTAGVCQAVLLDRLQRLVRVTGTNASEALPLSYILTPDNLLKMSLIYLRLQSRVPVVMMGETGCGKTSLVTALASVLGLRAANARFLVLNFHAGVGVQHIVDFVAACERAAAGATAARGCIKVLAFLDEVNTCDHLGLISELVCRSELLGRPVHAGVSFVAAVNPHRLRTAAAARGAGLHHSPATADPLSRLVYRVHPLPEAMLSYAWSFGALSVDDERRYLSRMMEEEAGGQLLPLHARLCTHLVAASQRFVVSRAEALGAVSLREPVRFKQLVAWFSRQRHARLAQKRQAAAAERRGLAARIFSRAPDEPMSSEAEVQLRSILLSLAFIYYCRFGTGEQRDDYMDAVTRELQDFREADLAAWRRVHAPGHSFASAGVSPRLWRTELRLEQLQYLGRMELPPGTALNEALRENVYVLLVCILNRMPVFLVGLPGCSKSLAMKCVLSDPMLCCLTLVADAYLADACIFNQAHPRQPARAGQPRRVLPLAARGHRSVLPGFGRLHQRRSACRLRQGAALRSGRRRGRLGRRRGAHGTARRGGAR